MQGQVESTPKSARHSREDIERGVEIIDERWSRELAKGDDEFDEIVWHRMNKQQKADEAEKPQRRRGRKI